MYPKITFNIEAEDNEQINYLDLSVCRKCNETTLCIYQKPTYTSTVIPNLLNYPRNCKMAAFNYLLNRRQNLPIMAEEREKEIKQTNSKEQGE